MKVSKVAATTARRLFGLCQSNGRLDDGKLRTAVARLAGDKPRDYRAILVALQRLVRLDSDRRKVLIESATPLDSAALARVTAGLESQYGQGLTVSTVVNPELIAGLRIRVGDDLLDGSVQGRLNRLAQAFS